MALIDKVRQLQELLEEKEGLAEATKNNNAAIKDLKEEIAQTMIDEDCPRIGCGDYTFSLQVKTKYSKKGEATLQAAGLDFFEVLREQGYGELIQETVNAQKLQSSMKECADQNGGELPEELADIISVYEENDIHRAKARSKAMSKAKEDLV